MSEAETEEVLLRVEGAAGRITLNRPKALHALTLNMCQRMIAALTAWRDDAAVQIVILDHTGERGFCAGGDIRTLAESGKGDGALGREFFFTEYRLNHLLFHYPKPIVAVMDGVVMGGGVGISLPARYRVGTERTVFAMPETAIGLVPDVGGGWYLPRLPGRTGFWLGLTGARLRAADSYHLGLVNALVASADTEALKADLVKDPSQVEARLKTDPQAFGPPPVAERQADIDRLFAADSLEGVLAALDADGSEWAAEQAKGLRTKSPTSLKVSMRQLSLGAQAASFADNLHTEYRIVCRSLVSHDFHEGVRAVIVDKDNAPAWRPATLEGVSEAQVDAYFAPLPAGEEWTPLGGDQA